ncbi:MAG: sensor histidine kinase [Solirubrobacteraceae bacterium]
MSVRAVLAVWSLALLAAGAGVALILASDRSWSVASIALSVVIGLAFVGCGLLARVRRPENRIGLLLMLVGFSWFGGALGSSDESLPFTLGYANGALIAAFFVHLVLAFPSGRLETKAERVVAAGMYAVALVLQPVWMLFDDLHGLKCDDCPANAFLIEHNDTLAYLLGLPTLAVVLGVLLAVTVILFRRWRAASPPLRRVLGPVYLSSAATVAILVVQTAVAPFSGFGADVFELLSVVALSTVPLSFLVGLVRTRLARTAVAELMTELGETPAPGSLRHALARALGDPSLELAYWLRDGTYVDPGGHVVALPADGSDRVATAVDRSGRPVAAIVHDASLRDHPELVDAVVAAAGLALENERLQAELRARLEELRASRFRLVETADVERRRLERNLHDGAQQRLVALSLSLALARRELASNGAAIELVDRTRSELAEALAELRELARGIHPPLLTDGGLKPALEALANRALLPVDLAGLADERLPASVEAAAYYLVAEALTNVAKYAGASTASVRVVRENGHVLVEVVDDGIGGADSRRGSGLRGLADRVEALDGRFDLHSPPGAGTRIRAEIPCEEAAVPG